jgi:hypothetical protein
MNTRTLGLIGILTSPFLAVDFIVNSVFQEYHPNSLSGVFSLIYMTGWLGCIVALYYSKASGHRRSGRMILIVQMCMLLLAEGWNVYTIINPAASSVLYRVLDAFWPISNCFMIVTGLTIINAKVLKGWQRFVPLLAGLWLPISILISIIVGKGSIATILTSGFYSSIVWFLLGLSVYSCANRSVSFKTTGAYAYQSI